MGHFTYTIFFRNKNVKYSLGTKKCTFVSSSVLQVRIGFQSYHHHPVIPQLT